MIKYTIFLGISSLAMAVPAVAKDINMPATGAPGGENAVSSTMDVGDIIVTASKRAENLSKAPLAITALSSEQLTTGGIQDIQKLNGNIPNVQFRTNSFGLSLQIAIRGITNVDFNEGGDPAVATYVDGAYVGRTQGLIGNLYDLERVEVLRGPQGTLYGRSATGGSVNIITADPKDKFEASADVSVGNYGDVLSHVMLNVPVNNTLAVRFAGVQHRNSGYFDTKHDTTENYGKSDDYGGRVTALWTPSSSFKVRISADKFVAGGTPGLSFDTASDGSLVGQSSIRHPVSLSNYPSPNVKIKNFMLRGRMDWGLANDLNLSYIGSYQRVSNSWQGIAQTSATYGGIRREKSRSNTQEINLSYDNGRLSNILGASYFNQTIDINTAYLLFIINLSDGVTDTAGTKSWGIFDQATYKLTDTFRVTAGIRYSHDRKSSVGLDQVGCPFGTFAPNDFDSIFQQQQPAGAGCFFLSNGDPQAGRFRSVTYKAGFEYDLTPTSMAYATVSTGFKPGGLNLGVPSKPTFSPEKVRNFELGLKSKLLDNRLRTNLALFYQKYSNLQVTQNQNTSQITTNAAAAEIYGFESEAQFQLSDSDRFEAFFNYLHATYKNFLNAVDEQFSTVIPSLNGNYLPFAPKFSARAQYSHEFLLPNGATLTPTGAIFWQTKSYLRGFNFAADRVGSFTKSNIDITYANSSDHWRISAFADNIENKRVRTSGYTALGHYSTDFSPPRTYGVRFALKFD